MNDYLKAELRRRMKLLRTNQKKLALDAGLGATAVRDILDDRSQNPTDRVLSSIAEQLGCTVDDLTGRKLKPAGARAPGELTSVTPIASDDAGQDKFAGNGLRIRELDVIAGNAINGDRHGSQDLAYNHETVVDIWQIPSAVVRVQTNAPADQLAIITAKGESNKPRILPGDKLMVDTTDLLPSPSGMFAVWDGFGLVVKLLEMVPFSAPPRVKARSINPDFPDIWEFALEDEAIRGRVIGRWDRT